MPHSRQTPLILMCATLLSASALSVTLAHPAPPTEEQIHLAQQTLALEAQLVDMQMKYSDSNPRVVALREQIARYKGLVTPQAEARVKPGLLHRLRARRADLRIQVLDAQTKYTDSNPRIASLREQIVQLDERIAEMQPKRH